MAKTDTAPPALAATKVARSPRVLDALAAVPRSRFAAGDDLTRELPPEAMARLCEDLMLDHESKVLVIEPASAMLPAVLAKLAAHVQVLAMSPSRAADLHQRLQDSGTTGAEVAVGRHVDGWTAAAPYDAVVIVQPALAELPALLEKQLSPRARVVLSPDNQLPPRRLVRLMRAEDGSYARDDIDLARFLPLLGDLLVAAGLVLHDEVVEASRAAIANKRRLGEELLARGAIREDDLYRTLAEQRRMQFAETRHALAKLDLELVRQLPRKYLDHYHFMPVHVDDGNRVQVVTTNIELPLWELRTAFEGREVVPALTTPTDLQRMWTAIELGLVAQSAPSQDLPAQLLPDEPAIAALPEETSRAAGTFDALLVDAVAERASDIHFEVYETGTRVRLRVDGSLHDLTRFALPASEMVAMVNVVKIAANLDIAERRAPQSGRVHRRTAGRTFDLRVQTQPALHGEHIVIRILPQDQKVPSIEDLGFNKQIAERYRRLLQEPHGMILVVGPTGSGKSTTLYAGLQLLANDNSRKVITIEDPIEYSLPKIQQAQVNSIVDFTFANAVRAFVREDPDVILVGEIRDGETALEAIRASQTGHLVLSTMHCNDTVDAAQRLIDLGMHPNSLASELVAIMAQRLGRRICVSCKQPAKPDDVLLAELFPHGIPADFQCFEGKGCPRCGGSGTKGRVAVIEFLRVGAEIRKAISRRLVLDDLRQLAQQHGLRSLRDSALELVQTGMMPMAEMYEVLSSEQMAPPGA